MDDAELVVEDNRLFIFTFSSIALAVASLILWRARNQDLHSPDSHTPHSILTAALSAFHIPSRPPGECDITMLQQPSTPESEHKPSRSKERRRRGKVSYKDLLKPGSASGSGRKSKPIIIKAKGRSPSNSSPIDSISESTTSSHNHNVTPSTVTSPLPPLLLHPTTELSPASQPHILPPSLIPSTSEPASVSRNTISSTIRPTRSEQTHLTDTIQTTCHDHPSPSIPELSFSSTPPLSEHYDSLERPASSSFTSYSQSQSMPLYPSDLDGKSQAHTAISCTKSPRYTHNKRGLDNSNTNRAISNSVSHNTPLASSFYVSPLPIKPSPSSSSSHQSHTSNTSSLPSPTLPHVTFPTLNPLQASPNDHTHTHPSAIQSPTTKSAGTPSRGSTPPSGVTTHTGRIDSPVGGLLTAHTQLASMRGALEAARLREEKARSDAECIGKENEELKWRWSEDAMSWRRREGQLHTQIHHLMQQLQATYSVLATVQAHAHSSAQPSSTFSSPVSPSPHLHPLSPNLSHNVLSPNFSRNPPVQALLGSSYHTYPGFPGSYGAGMSPLFFAGMSPGSSVANGSAGGRAGQYTSDASSSAGSSPPRGRRRRRRASGSWSVDNNSQEMGELEEDQDDPWRNSVLVDAILKRPESLRMSSGGSFRKNAVDASRVPSRMSERSDACASGGSYGMGATWEKGEGTMYRAIAESDFTLGDVSQGGKAGGEGIGDGDGRMQDSLSWDLIAHARDVQ